MNLLKSCELKHNNKCLIVINLIIMSVILLSCFFMVTLPREGYNPEVYSKVYLYFVLFQFLLYSVLISFWDITDLNIDEIVRDAVVFVVSIVPLIFMIFIIGQIRGANILLPLLVQIIWGITILSLKSLLHSCSLAGMWVEVLLNIFQFIVVIVSLAFLYFIVCYQQIVVTTVFDKDISLIFFLNPLLTALGLLHTQIGGTTQMGSMPYVTNILFWSLASLIFNLVRRKVNKSQGA